MDPITITLIVSISALVIKYGPEAVQSAINALNKDNITLEDIQNLKITKEPETY